MKFKYIFIQIVSIGLLLSCGKDNYDEPQATLTGRVVHEGKPIGVRGSNNSVRLQLWQNGFALKTPIDVYVAQDGSYTAKLFDGDYQLITVSGNGPWAHSTDTLQVQVKGNTTVDINVRPYYTLENIQYQLNGTKLQATFQLNKIDETRNLDNVNLLINDTKFVDLGNFEKRSSIDGNQSGAITIELDIANELNTKNTLFARVAVKMNGITEAVYDPNIFRVK
ncbi:MAG: DUF3823 domain-containing protein [Sphingobacterium composti]|uniref:DUF3823 domain-containing protein n=1 Tax=Sphingobacterium composti TaxID=363260 RepID=UPI0013573369|nr:DUF3823 domain-containing protein [Sphingobacterium composti Ten et al. 2007 non Yoo et al. 2007]